MSKIEIQRALERKVELKSGGYLIIDQTEAMTTIDINTGAFVGHRNLEETIFNTNVEATAAIARQLRLRNLGGIIIIDFIDMQSEDHRRRVLQSLEQALAKDRAKTGVNGFSQLGLVEMTRKRTRESLEHVLCSQCPECNGRGRVKTVESVCTKFCVRSCVLTVLMMLISLWCMPRRRLRKHYVAMNRTVWLSWKSLLANKLRYRPNLYIARNNLTW